MRASGVLYVLPIPGEVAAEDAFGAFNFAANCAVIEVDFSSSMPISDEDQRQ